MSIEIKNLCINVSIAARENAQKTAELEQWRSDVLDECRKMVLESVAERKER